MDVASRSVTAKQVAAAELTKHQAAASPRPLGNRSLLLLLNAKSATNFPQEEQKAEQQPGGVGLLLCFGETSEHEL